MNADNVFGTTCQARAILGDLARVRLLPRRTGRQARAAALISCIGIASSSPPCPCGE